MIDSEKAAALRDSLLRFQTADQRLASAELGPDELNDAAEEYLAARAVHQRAIEEGDASREMLRGDE